MDKPTKKGRKNKNSRFENMENEVFTLKEKMVENTKTNWVRDIKIQSKFRMSGNHKDFFLKATSDSTKIIFLDGPAGTAKSYLSILAALNLLKKGEIEKIYYIRTIVESAEKSLGSLPGTADEKFSPYMAPLIEKLEELLPMADVKKLCSTKVIEACPINFWRGRTATNAVVIFDEVSNATSKEIITCLTRIGEGTRMFIIGDVMQTDIGHKSGFMNIFDKFSDRESYDFGIHTMQFTENDIVRSEILKFIVRKLDNRN